MRKQLFLRFFRDRFRWLFFAVLQTTLVFFLLYLLTNFTQENGDLLQENLGYALLISGIVFLLFLIWDWIRWHPFIKELNRWDQQEKTGSLKELSDGGTLEQILFGQTVQRMKQQVDAQRENFYEQYRQHLDFMNLWVHQMKTPLSAVDLWAQGLRGKGIKTEGVEEEIEKLDEGLNLVLYMARLQDFSRDFHIRSIDLLQVIRDIINSRKKTFIRNRIFPKIEAEQGPWVVLTDEKWNRFVLEQIVQNALKYASQVKRDSSFLIICLKRSSSGIQLTIQDQGPGIPIEDLPRIFEPFFTGNNGRRFDNATGIGLYLVKQVLDQMEHRIEVHSEIDQGTMVMIHYPISS